MLRVGAFTARTTGYREWTFECDWLPDWQKVVECTTETAWRLLAGLSAENRSESKVAETGRPSETSTQERRIGNRAGGGVADTHGRVRRVVEVRRSAHVSHGHDRVLRGAK